MCVENYHSVVRENFPKGENLDRDLTDEKNVFLPRSKGSGFLKVGKGPESSKTLTWQYEKDQKV